MRRTQFVCRRGRRLSAARSSKPPSCRGLLRVLLLLTLRALLPLEPVRGLRLGLPPLLACVPCVPALPLLPERLGGPWPPWPLASGTSEGGRRNTLGAMGIDLDKIFSKLSSRSCRCFAELPVRHTAHASHRHPGVWHEGCLEIPAS